MRRWHIGWALVFIEAQMTPAQLEAIAAVQLTPDDLRTWAQDQGLNMGLGGGQGVSPEAQATRQAQFEGMSEEQRAALRAITQAGGGPRQPLFLLRPLIELLQARAGEGG